MVKRCSALTMHTVQLPRPCNSCVIMVHDHARLDTGPARAKAPGGHAQTSSSLARRGIHIGLSQRLYQTPRLNDPSLLVPPSTRPTSTPSHCGLPLFTGVCHSVTPQPRLRGPAAALLLQHIVDARLAEDQVHNRLAQARKGSRRAQRRLALPVLRLRGAAGASAQPHDRFRVG